MYFYVSLWFTLISKKD